MNRRILIIGAVVIGIVVIITLIWVLFGRGGNGGVTATPGTQFPGGGDPYEGTAPELGTAIEAGDELAPHLIRITESPVALGATATFIERTETLPQEGTSTPVTRTVRDVEVRYVDRASGNIYAYRMDERTLTRLTNRTIPGVQEAAWLPNGSMAFVRYLGESDAEAYALPANGNEGYALESGLSQAFVSGSSTIITLLSGSNGTIATAARSDGTGARTIFNSVLSSLRAYSAGTGYAAVTKASAQTDGYAFMLRGATLERVLGPLKGLTILPSPSGKLILYTYLSGTSVKSAIYDTTTNAATTLPVVAMPDKCVWSADESDIYCGIPRSVEAGWPDTWYQGVTQFTDRIWRIDVAGRIASLVVDPKIVANVDIDAVALTLDRDADALVFTNRNDGSLWLYDL